MYLAYMPQSEYVLIGSSNNEKHWKRLPVDNKMVLQIADKQL